MKNESSHLKSLIWQREVALIAYWKEMSLHIILDLSHVFKDITLHVCGNQ